MFSAIFTKGNNFRDLLFAFLPDEALAKWGLFLTERICPRETYSSLYESILTEKENKNGSERVAFPEGVPLIIQKHFL